MMPAPPTVSRKTLVLLNCVAALAVVPAAPAATLPTGFAETQVATGLAAPTAMAFAPDGRLFVTEQGGQLRVIKNGALLADALPDRQRQLDPASAACSASRSTRTSPSTSTSTSTTRRSGSPIHNRVSRFTAMGDVVAARQRGRDPRAREPLQRDEPQRRRAALRPRRHAVRRGRRQRERRERADARQPPRQDAAAVNPDGGIPTDNPFYGTATGANRAIWALGLRNPFTFTFQPGTGRMFINDVGQNTWEEINDGIAGSNYGWPDTEGRDDRSALPRAALLLRARLERDDRLRDHRRRLLQPGDGPVPELVHGRLLLRRLLQRLDPQARPGGRQHGHRLRDRHREPGRPRGRERRQPLLPRARLGRRGLPRRLHGEPGAEHHDASGEPDGADRRDGDVHRRGQRHAAARLPVAAERRRHPRRDLGELQPRVRDECGQRRPLPGAGDERRRQRPQQRGDADGDVEPAARGHDLPTPDAERSTAPARPSPTRARARIPRTGRCPRARSRGRSTSTTPRTSTRSSHPRAERRAARSCRRPSAIPSPTSGTASS